MTIQYSDGLRNNQANNVEATIGVSPKLQIRTGAVPANCAAADSGTLLVEIPLPADWLGPAAAGAVAKLGTWSAAAVAAGTAGHFRVKDTSGTVTHIQGTAVMVAGTGDLVLDNTSIAIGQVVTITTFSITRGNP